MKTCNAGYYDWCKGEALVYEEGEKRYCVFHAPKDKKGEDKKGITPDEFNRRVFAEIDKAKKENSKCDLAGTVFPGDISFHNYGANNPLPEISFIDAHFGGEAKFRLAQFVGEAHFRNARFGGAAHFWGTQFSGKADFGEAEFGGVADFGIAQFCGEADFGSARFGGKADFMRAQFCGAANFWGAQFGGAANFYGPTFSEKNKSNLLSLHIGGKLRLEGVNLEKVSFIDTDLRKIDFTNCKWPKKNKREVLCDELELYEKNKSPDKEKIKKVELLYRRLKQKYIDEHDYAEVSNWHFGEKEMQRKRISPKEFFTFCLLNLYGLLSGYCERPFRAGIVLLLWIVYFSIIFGFAGIEHPSLSVFQYSMLDRNPLFIPKEPLQSYYKLFSQILISLQAALFALAVRNRFRR